MSYKSAAGGTPLPVGGGSTATEDKDRRISPNTQQSLGQKQPHYEYMEKGQLLDKDNRGVVIDIDRDGGVFLDHGELARILEAGNTDAMVAQINKEIGSAKGRYEMTEKTAPDHYRVK